VARADGAADGGAQRAPAWVAPACGAGGTRACQNPDTSPPPGRGAGAELDRLSNILKSVNDQFGNIHWTDADRIHKLITEEIPACVSADKAYQNARKNSDKQNARIEHEKALGRVMTAVLNDDAELFKQFSDNAAFRRWLTDKVFEMTYA
jgi:type I restriction enzyme, R subunit